MEAVKPKYLTTLNKTQSTSAYNAFHTGYGYQKFLAPQSSDDKQKWHFSFLTLLAELSRSSRDNS